MGGLRHDGDAIAHDLRSPLTPPAARMEVALIDAENGKGDPLAALETALADADGVLKTFNAVLAIARLQARRRRAGSEELRRLGDGQRHGRALRTVVRGQGSGLQGRDRPALTIKAIANSWPRPWQTSWTTPSSTRPRAAPSCCARAASRRASWSSRSPTTGRACPRPTGPAWSNASCAWRIAAASPRGSGLVAVVRPSRPRTAGAGAGRGSGRVQRHGPGLRVALVLPRVE